jgi:hypothetical protein
MPLISELTEELREEVDSLTEKKSTHWPFKIKSKLGPGPRGGRNKQTDRWECTCGNYICMCKGTGGDNKGQKKEVRIGREYKKEYNSLYKAWVAKQKKGKKKSKKKG